MRQLSFLILLLTSLLMVSALGSCGKDGGGSHKQAYCMGW